MLNLKVFLFTFKANKKPYQLLRVIRNKWNSTRTHIILYETQSKYYSMCMMCMGASARLKTLNG